MSVDINLFDRIDFNPTQLEALQCGRIHRPTVRAVMGQGGWGSGKSTWAQADLLHTTVDNPGIPCLVIRLTREQILDSVIPDLEEKFTSPDHTKRLWPEEILKGGKWDRAFFPNDRKEYLEFRDGGVWHFRGAIYNGREDPSKFGSIPFGAGWFEEFSDFKSPKTFKYVDGRMRWFNPSNPNGYNRIILSGNPPDDDSHWSQDEFIKIPAKKPKVRALRAFFRLPTRENVKHLAPGYIENLEDSYSPAWIKRYLEGFTGIIEEGMPVLKDHFSPETPTGKEWHVSEERIVPVKGVPVWCGLDFGVAYMSAVWAQYSPDLEAIVVHLELTGRETSAYHFGSRIKQVNSQMWPSSNVIYYGDPSGSRRSEADMKSAFSVMKRKHGIKVIPAPTNDFEARRDAYFEFLSRSKGGHPMLVISNHEGTESLQESLELGWALPDNMQGYVEPDARPRKNRHSHPADALGYVLVSLVGKISRAGLEATVRRQRNRGSLDSGRRYVKETHMTA